MTYFVLVIHINLTAVICLSHFEHKFDVTSDILLRDEESCDATPKNKLYGDAGALHCLSSGVADVAFINAYNLPMILGKQHNIKH